MATSQFTTPSLQTTALCAAACSWSPSWGLRSKWSSRTTFWSIFLFASSSPSLTSMPRLSRLRAVTRVGVPIMTAEARQQSNHVRTPATTKRTRPYSMRAKWPAIPTSFTPSSSSRSVLSTLFATSLDFSRPYPLSSASSSAPSLPSKSPTGPSRSGRPSWKLSS